MMVEGIQTALGRDESAALRLSSSIPILTCYERHDVQLATDLSTSSTDSSEHSTAPTLEGQ